MSPLRIHASEKGFTILEVVVTLIVASILGAMFIELMSTNLTGSIRPLTGVQNAFTVNQAMEAMTADFKKLTATDSSFLTTFQTHVRNGNVAGNSPYYGPYVLEYNDFISFDNSGSETAGGQHVLRVTISVGNQRLTALFTK